MREMTNLIFGSLEELSGFLEKFKRIFGDLNFVRKNAHSFELVKRTFRFQMEVLKSEVWMPLWPPNSPGAQI